MSIYTSEKTLSYVYRLDNPITGEFYFGYRKANKIPSNLDLPRYKTSAPEIHKSFHRFNWKIIAEFHNGDDAYDFEQLSIFEEWDNPLLLNKSCYHNKKRFTGTSNRIYDTLGNKNPMYDKPCYYNMTEVEKQNWLNNVQLGKKNRKYRVLNVNSDIEIFELIISISEKYNLKTKSGKIKISKVSEHLPISRSFLTRFFNNYNKNNL